MRLVVNRVLGAVPARRIAGGNYGVDIPEEKQTTYSGTSSGTTQHIWGFHCLISDDCKTKKVLMTPTKNDYVYVRKFWSQPTGVVASMVYCDICGARGHYQSQCTNKLWQAGYSWWLQRAIVTNSRAHCRISSLDVIDHYYLSVFCTTLCYLHIVFLYSLCCAD
jgi:hypothetical protein